MEKGNDQPKRVRATERAKRTLFLHRALVNSGSENDIRSEQLRPFGLPRRSFQSAVVIRRISFHRFHCISFHRYLVWPSFRDDGLPASVYIGSQVN